MGKKVYTDYDDTLFGKYIRQIENPDSTGWDSINKIWKAPTKKGYDKRNRGMGVDVVNNAAAKETVIGRDSKYLTEEEEHQLRNEHIQYVLDVINRQKNKYPGLQNMSPRKQAEVIGTIYRGDAGQLWDGTSILGKALNSSNEEDFHNAIEKFYKSKNLKERVKNNNLFWKKMSVLSTISPIVEHSEMPDATRVYKDRQIPFKKSNTPIINYTPEQRNTIKYKSEGGFLQPKDAWDALSMEAKAEMMKVAINHGIYNLDGIRKKYNEFAEGGSKEEAEEVNTDSQYINTMERVAEENYMDWGFDNPDEALLHALNDNTYDYKGYYNKYPQSRANANTHWTDEFKTVYHPTFSNESIYSGKVSQYNPQGIVGGFWANDTFIPSIQQVMEESKIPLLDYLTNEYKNGGGIHIKPSKKGTFTAAASKHGKSVQAFASQVLAHPENYSPAMRKKANFARNAAKWHGLGGNLFDGITQPTQKMQIGLDVLGWPNYTTEQIVAYGDENERRRKAIQDAYLNFVTESNDATAVANGRPQNQHLVDKAARGAKAHAAWEKEHPNLTAWGNILSAVPFAIAASPTLEAIASTTVGQGFTSGLNFITNATKAMPYASTILPWSEATLATASVTHGIEEAKKGTFTPITALEISPLVPPAIGIGSNLYLPHFREHLYASKAPIGYDGMWPAAKRITEGILSGRRADIENPFWFNNESAETLAKEFAFVPRKISETEKTEYLKDFGQRALKARADMWRMYNRLSQKYNTFIESEKYPGAYTAPEDIKALKWVPFPDKNVDPGDFVNSVGGNVGLPEITNLGKGIPDMGYTAKEFGVTTLSDLWDLHPFSRPNDRLISRVKRGYNKLFNTDKAPEFKWLRPLDNILAKAEVGKLVHAKPILVKNEIPWTMDRKLITDANGNLNFKTSYTQGFNSNNILPQSVIDWKSGKPYIEISDIQNNPENFDFLKYNLVTKSKNR